MEGTWYKVKMRGVKLLNALLILAPIVAGWCLFYKETAVGLQGEMAVVMVSVVYILLYATFGRVYNSFLVSLTGAFELILSQCLAFFLSDCVLYGLISFFALRLVSVLPMLGVFLAQVLLSVGWCVLTQMWYFRAHPAKKTVIVYDQKASVEEMIREYGLERKFEVVRIEAVEDCVKNQCGCLEGAEVVFLGGISSHERNLILKYCVEKNIAVYLLPRIGDIIMNGAKATHLFHLPFLRAGRYSPTPEYVLMKRAFDIAVSGVAILMLLPVWVIVSAAIKLGDGGPVFYRQVRLTKDGKKFQIIKFRSMRQDAEKDGVARLSSGDNDNRITPVGRIIRKIRVDELPQLFNILGGSMSLVGPRPERPEIAKEYEESLPEFSLRLQVKAGLTGYAQVYGKYNTAPYDKLQMDLMYIAHPSFLQDLRILLVTVKVLFISKSVEGISEDATTALVQQKQEKERSRV